MTSEVCVMNNLGIALAADSAVTISSGARGEKSYPSAEKLFGLSNEAPVGVMVYGNASYLGLLWETIFKEYRKRLGSRRFSHLKEYANDLLQFLSDTSVFSDETQDLEVESQIEEYYSFVLGCFEKRLTRESDDSENVEEEKIAEIMESETKNICDYVMEFDRLEEFDERTISRIERKYRDRLVKKVEELSSKIPLDDSSKDALYHTGYEFLTRSMFWRNESGIVIAGFGELEFFPRMYSYRIDGRIMGKLRVILDQSVEHDANFTSSVRAFAQKDMVYTFLDGVSPDLLHYFKNSAFEAAYEIISSMGEVLESDFFQSNPEAKSILEKKSEEIMTRIFDGWDEKKRENWYPILHIVSYVPKEELASMAESLVNITQFRQRVSTEIESVGGHIDVAMITRGDGFVWIKKKHYFGAELNPRIMAKYLRPESSS